MKTSVHPTSKIRYTVERYVREYGSQFDAAGHEQRRPSLVCVSCGHPMHTVAENGPLENATWSHNFSKDAPWCPLKETNGGKYPLCAPIALDSIASQKIRQKFFEHWQLHWSHILEIAPFCEISKFVRFIEHADSIRFWAHSGLEDWQIPYIFLATCDFPPPKNKKAAASQPEWIRFRFDARIRHTNDLWRRNGENWEFIRSSYTAPAQGREPNPTEIIDVEPIFPDSKFLERVKPEAHATHIKAMKMYFPWEVIE